MSGRQVGYPAGMLLIGADDPDELVWLAGLIADRARQDDQIKTATTQIKRSNVDLDRLIPTPETPATPPVSS